MLDTAERLAPLTNEARTIYRRLVWWWLTGEGASWSRRELHQRLKSGGRFPHVADLDGPLDELVAAGLVRPWHMPTIGRRREVRHYALVEPQHRRGRRPGRVPAPSAAPPVEVPPATHDAAPSPPPNTEGQTDPLAWRVEAMWRQITAAGGLVPVMARPGLRARPGQCRSCGDPLAGSPEGHCDDCTRAMLAVLGMWQGRSTGSATPRGA